MKKLILHSLLILFMGILSFSCKQSETAPPPTNTELLIRLPWHFSAAVAGGTDVSSAPQLTCFKDNTITFTGVGGGSIDEGTTVCAPSTAGNFTWTFGAGETQLTINSANPLVPGGTNTFTIVSLTSTNLVLSQTVTIGTTPTPVTFTFVH